MVLVGVDRASDLAVVRVDGAPEGALQPIKVGTSSDLRVGQSCYALGFPEDGTRTLSAGTVSGLKRSIPSKNGTTIRGAIQTDAKIAEVAAGGALLDSSARLIGLNVTTYSSGATVNGRAQQSPAGVNFAIPVDSLVTVVPALITLPLGDTSRR